MLIKLALKKKLKSCSSLYLIFLKREKETKSLNLSLQNKWQKTMNLISISSHKTSSDWNLQVLPRMPQKFCVMSIYLIVLLTTLHKNLISYQLKSKQIQIMIHLKSNQSQLQKYHPKFLQATTFGRRRDQTLSWKH